MPKQARVLTDKEFREILKKDAVTAQVGGAPGLFIQIRSKNARSWILRITKGYKENGTAIRANVGLGSYPEIGLAQARKMARDYKPKALEGLTPRKERAAQRAAIVAAQKSSEIESMTFDKIYPMVIASKKSGWKNQKHAVQWTSTLSTYASPVIGHVPVRELTTEHIKAVMNPIWDTIPETANRVRGRIEQIIAWSVVNNYREDVLNPARWTKHLDQIFTSRASEGKQPALPYGQMKGFFQALQGEAGLAAQALRLLILTAKRTSEILEARWSEFDLEACLWTIPAARMKAGKEDIIPLSSLVIEFLQRLPRIDGSDYLFPGSKDKPLSNMTLTALLIRMHEKRLKADSIGYVDPKQRSKHGKPKRITVHGFRSTFRDWAGDLTDYDGDMAEMALSHAISSKTEASYRRGEMLAKRFRLMQDWAEFCQGNFGQKLSKISSNRLSQKQLPK